MQSVPTTPRRGQATGSWPVDAGRTTLELTPAVLERLRASCAASPDEETGGLLIGDAGTCTEVLTLRNASAGDRRTSYVVDADDVPEPVGGLIGWWHSHVGRSPRPSPGDVADAPWSTFQVIVTLLVARGIRVSRWWVDECGRWHDLGELRWP